MNRKATTIVTNDAGGEIATLIELARQQQAKRKIAPRGFSQTDIRVYPKEMIHSIAAKTGGQDAKDGFHHLFVDGRPETLRRYATQGYEPCQYEDGTLVRNDTDVMVRCPTEQYDEANRQTVAEGNRRLSRALQKDINDAAAISPNTTVKTGRVSAADLGLDKAQQAPDEDEA